MGASDNTLREGNHEDKRALLKHTIYHFCAGSKDPPAALLRDRNQAG